MIKTKLIRKVLKGVISSLFLLGGGLLLAAQDAPEMEMAMPNLNAGQQEPVTVSPEVRLQQIQAEFLQIDKKLQILQQQALQDPVVQEKEAAYLKALKSEMLSIASKDQVSKVKKRFKLSQKLDNAASPETQMTQQQLISLSNKFEAARKAVSSIEDEAATTPKVQEKEEAFVNLVTQKMKAANPNLNKLFQRQQELAQEFQMIQNQLGS